MPQAMEVGLGQVQSVLQKQGASLKIRATEKIQNTRLCRVGSY